MRPKNCSICGRSVTETPETEKNRYYAELRFIIMDSRGRHRRQKKMLVCQWCNKLNIGIAPCAGSFKGGEP